MAEDPPKFLLDIDGSYRAVTLAELGPGERQLVEAIIQVGLDMVDCCGRRRPFIIPPAVALCAMRAVGRIAEEFMRLQGRGDSGTPQAPANHTAKDYPADENAGIPTAKG